MSIYKIKKNDLLNKSVKIIILKFGSLLTLFINKLIKNLN